ncbi:MAG TPA: hypothetical protein VFR87_11565 [Nocardioidaceae bacterium]|nr:hypothetical protein [Nocardioidaceae bacterium]
MTRMTMELTAPGRATSRARWRGAAVARKVGLGLAAAVVAGAAMGLVARLMMRLASVAAGEPGHFSLAGTAGILMVFVVVVVPGGVVASLVRRRGRSSLLWLGALLLCVPTTGVARVDLGGLVGLSPAQWVGVGLATLGVYVAVLALPVVTLRILARWS